MLQLPDLEEELAFLAIDPVVAGRIIYSIIFIVGLYLLGKALRSYIDVRVEEPRARTSLKRAVSWITMGVTIVAVGILWLERLGGFSVALGLVAAAATFALREVVASFAGWLLITSGRAYGLGDRIEMGGIQGDVIGFGILRTSLMEIGNWVKGDQPTGRIVTISNAAVFQQPVYNYTMNFHFLWDELHIPLTFASNLPKANEIVMAIATQHTEDLISVAREEMEQMARRYKVGDNELRPSVYVTFNDNWVELALRYVTEARRRRRTNNKLSQQILAALSAEPDIQFSSETLSVTVHQRNSRQ